MPYNQQNTQFLNNIHQDVVVHHLAAFLSPFEVLNLLSSCPEISVQKGFSDNHLWKEHHQRYLPFVEFNADADGVLPDEELKNAFIAEIRCLLKAIKNNNNNWREKLRRSELLTSDKLFMYEAINRNSEAYKLLSPALKPDRELICAAVRKNNSKNLLRHVPVNRQWELSASRNMGLLGVLIVFQIRSCCDSNNGVENINGVIAKYLFILSICVILSQRIKPYSVFGFFAKRYPGNHIESYEEAPEEHKNDESSDDEDNDIFLPLNI